MSFRRALLPVLFVSLLARTAAAEGGKVMVFPVGGQIPSDPGDGKVQLAQVVARAAGLSAATANVSRADFADTAALAGCEGEDLACFGKVADMLRVDSLIVTTIRPTEPGSFVVELRWYDAVTGNEQRHEAPVAGRNFDELKQSFLRGVTDAFVGWSAAPGTEPPPPTPTPTPTPPPVTVVVEPIPTRQAEEPRFDVGRVDKWPWIVAGSGVALAGFGTVLWILAADRQDQVDSAPTQTPADLDRLADLEDEGERYATLGNALFIGGMVAALGGAGWAAWQATRVPQREAPSVAPMAVSGGGGVVLTVPLP